MFTRLQLQFSMAAKLVALVESLAPDISSGDDASDKHRFLGELRRVSILHKLSPTMEHKYGRRARIVTMIFAIFIFNDRELS